MTKDLKHILDGLYRDYDFKEAIMHDPIKFPRRYRRVKDIEVVGLIASALAYGRVRLFMPVIEKILQVMGTCPHDFLIHFDPQRQGHLFEGIKYRFQGTHDIIALLYITGALLKEHESIHNLFKKFYNGGDTDIKPAFSGMVGHILGKDTSAVYGKDIRPVGLLQLFPSPDGGGACKRLCLYLRWMVRDRDIDLGIWKGIPPDKLIIPLDTHIMRVSRCLGLTRRGSVSWKTAVEITGALRRFDPVDPLKYDFVLCHMGISGDCRLKKDCARGAKCR